MSGYAVPLYLPKRRRIISPAEYLREKLAEQRRARESTMVQAVSLNAVGTVAWAAGGNVTPGLPAGWQPDDIHICITTGSDNVAATNANYTSKQAVNNGAICRQTILWRRAVAGDTAPVITHTGGDTFGARIFGFRGCIASGDPIEAINGGSTGSGIPVGSALTATATAITPLTPGAAIVFALSWTCSDTSNFTVTGSYSGTNPAFTEIADNTATAVAVNEADQAVAWGLKTDTTSTGSRTAVGTNVTASTINWVATLLALTPAAVTPAHPPQPLLMPLSR